jgi:hypothetical protein
LAVITLGTGIIAAQSNASLSDSDFPRYLEAADEHAKAPTVITGDNVYIVWFTNVGTVNSNYEVGFRASTDNGQTFDPITHVSYTDNYDSVNAEISAEGDNVIVSYEEQNDTSFLPLQKYQLMVDKPLGKDSTLQTMRMEL